jgi:hypothetical protein
MRAPHFQPSLKSDRPCTIKYLWSPRGYAGESMIVMAAGRSGWLRSSPHSGRSRTRHTSTRCRTNISMCTTARG